MVIVLILNAVLYVVALSLSLAVLTPVPEGASRRVRIARRALVCGGGLTMSVAITLSFMGRWFESGLAGCVAIVVVCTCLWLGLTSRFSHARRGRRRRPGRWRRAAQAPRPAGAAGARGRPARRAVDRVRSRPRRLGARARADAT